MTKELWLYNGEKTFYSKNGAGKTGQLYVKNENRTVPNTTHRNRIKMDYRPKCKARNSLRKI